MQAISCQNHHHQIFFLLEILLFSVNYSSKEGIKKKKKPQMYLGEYLPSLSPHILFYIYIYIYIFFLKESHHILLNANLVRQKCY